MLPSRGPRSPWVRTSGAGLLRGLERTPDARGPISLLGDPSCHERLLTFLSEARPTSIKNDTLRLVASPFAYSVGRRTSKAGTGSVNPLRSSAPMESKSKSFPTQSSRTAVETAMPPGEAAAHSRADS
jgi:hypothetical protein